MSFVRCVCVVVLPEVDDVRECRRTRALEGEAEAEGWIFICAARALDGWGIGATRCQSTGDLGGLRAAGSVCVADACGDKTSGEIRRACEVDA